MAVFLASGLDIAFSVIDILKGSFALSLPLFAAAFLGAALHKKITEKFKLSWFAGAAVVCFLLSLLLV